MTAHDTEASKGKLNGTPGPIITPGLSGITKTPSVRLFPVHAIR